MTKLRLNPLRAPLVYRRWLALAPMLTPALALAGPTGGTVIAGQVNIGQPDPLTTLVQQSSQNAVVNWQQFNVGSQELVQFIQPSASAAILNRIVGGSPSEILGNISANGRVFLINTQGVMFGAGSRVDVAGLVASTLDIADADFMSGRYVLAGNGSGAGVVNQGQINAADGGFVVLAGDSARNSGLIQARLGDIVLASGSAMTLDLAGDGLINYHVDGAALSQAAGVANSGQLLADGGRVLMSAEVARGLVRDVVNNSGLIRATGVAEENGEILLIGAGGNVVNTGTLDASSANGTGGSIQVLGDRDIRIEAGLIDASGTQGGGEIRLGGGIQGGEGLIQAERLYLAQAATVRADATVLGDGGRIAAYSKDHSVLAGLLSARGGAQGGDGGFVETSSAGLLTVTQVPELAGDTGGHWLIDPEDIDIVAGNGYGGINNSNPFVANGDNAQLGVALITGALANGSSVTISTGGTGSQAGNINLLAALDYNGTGNGTLTLDAAGGIFLNQQIFDSTVGGDSLNLNLNAGGSISLGNSIDLGAGGAANLLAGGTISLGDLTASSIHVDAVGGVSLAATRTLRSTTGGIYLAGASLELAGLLDSAAEIDVYARAGDISGAGDYTAAGYIDLYANEDSYGGSAAGDVVVDQLHAGGGIDIGADGKVQLGANSGYGDVVTGRDYVSIYGDSISSSGNIVASSGYGDVSLDLSAEAGSIDIAGSLVAVSDYGGAALYADAYQGTVYNPLTDSYETVGGDISVGSVHVRAATYSSPQSNPHYGYDLLSYQPAASALLAADGDITIGDVRVESYTPLLYASYGGDETLSAASAQLLINPGSHSFAGTVSLGKVEVYGYGDAHALIRGSGSVNLSGGLIVHSFVAQYQRDESLSCDCSNPLTETILLGNATADIGEFVNYNTQTLAGNGYSGDLASPDFKVSLGYLNVQGPNALARISAGSLEIGTDSDTASASFGYSVLVQSHIGVKTNPGYLDEASHTITDSTGQVVYQDNISQAQAEFITSSAAGPEHDSQLYRGQVRVGGREAGLSLQAAYGGSIRVADAMIGNQLVRGSVEVEGLGYVVDGDYYDYAYGGRSFDSYGLFLRPSLIDAPVVTQFDDSSPSPYLHWGSAGFRVVGGEFVPYDPQNPSYGGYLNDAAAGSLSIAGDLSIHGVGNADGELWADQISLGTAGRGDSVSVSASQGEVYGEQGIAYDYGYYISVEPEYYSVTDPVTSEVYTYEVRRQVSGNLAVTTAQGSIMAATAGLAGLSFDGGGSLQINGDLSLSGLSAEVGINDFANATITGAVGLDGRPEGSSPAYFREDVSFVGAYDSVPPPLASGSSVLIGGRSGMQVSTQSLRIGNGIDIRGTFIAGLLIDSADAEITGDVRVDAATGHVESNDPTTTAEAVNVDLGLAAIRLGASDGNPVRIVAGGDGSGSLTVIGGTEVDLGGLNLVADGDVQFDAGSSGSIRQSMRDLVEQFEHPFSNHDNGYGGNPMLLAASPTVSSDSLSDLLNSSSRTCYNDIADCGFLVRTQSGGDIALLGGLIEASQGNFEAAGGFNASAANGLSLGRVVSTGVLALHNSGDLSLSGELTGASITLSTEGSFSNPEALSISAGNGGVSIEAASISSSGLLSISSTGGLHLSAGSINLAGYDLSATGEARLEGTTLNLGAGELSAGSLVLAAANALNLTGSSLASGGSATLSGSSVQLSDALVEAAGSLSITSSNALLVTAGSGLQANNLSLNGKTVTLDAASSLAAGSLTVISTGLLKLDHAQVDSSGALSLSSSGGSVALSNGSLLRGRTIQLSGKGAVSVENSRLEILGTTAESTDKALATYPAGSINLQGAGLTLRNAQLAGGDINLLGGAGLITLDGGSIEGNIVRIEAHSVTTPSAVQISANGFGARGAILDFGLASFTFGTGAAPFGDDNGLFAALPEDALDLQPSTTHPNASFIASQLLAVGDIGGSAQYLLFDSSDFTFKGDVHGAADLFLQIIPSDDQKPLGISDLSFARFARTLAIGGADYVGDIFLLDDNQRPANKALSAGTDTNYIFLTEGQVSGVEKISTNGRVVVIDRGEVPEDIQNAPARDLVLIESDFSDDGDDEGPGNLLHPDRGLPGHGTVSSDDSSDTQQQCDAI
jgi:fibronectin-binding autotransporter adhesin